MSDFEAVGKEIMAIEGVTGYVILKADGRVVVSENVSNPETAASCIAFSAMSAMSVKQGLGLSRLLRIAFIAEDAEDVLVLPLKDHLAGILKSPYAPIEEVIANYQKVVKRIAA